MRPVKKVPIPTALYTRAVHCPMCTHTVDASVVQTGRQIFVKPGEKCPRCLARLDAAYVLGYDRAA
jgi:uncharacterized protein (UPF0212 family)